MNKKEYAKLIIDTTTIATKAKILLDQLKQTMSLRQKEFSAAELTLSTTEQALINPAKANTEHKSTLKRLNFTLKTTIEYQILTFKKQFDQLKKTFEEKILINPGLADTNHEFDLSNVFEQIEQIKVILPEIDHEIIASLDQLNNLQQKITVKLQIFNDLFLNHELKRATENINRLGKKIHEIQLSVTANPELMRTHSNDFTPLCTAMRALSVQRRTLWQEEVDPSNLSHSVIAQLADNQATELASPERIQVSETRAEVVDEIASPVIAETEAEDISPKSHASTPRM